MAADMNALSEQLVKKSFSDCTADELRQLTADYPFFAPAHFLLLKKLDPSTEAYREQYQKAILYFHDPLAFEYFINRSDFEGKFEPLDEAPETLTEQPEVAIQTASSFENTDADTEDEAVAEEILEQESLPIPPPLPVAAGTEDLSFEPYHTVDYFASQGIKLSVDEVSNDKFGKQLKSFTDWLKTMKRLPVSETTRKENIADNKVEALAGNSVETTEIITESMAEVWLKQGNREKAEEVYRKLSLLEPSKNAYFAAKIQSLKE